MLEKLLELFLRLVVALESIAQSYKTEVSMLSGGVPETMTPPIAQTGQPDFKPGENVVLSTDYEKIASMPKGRETLLDLCKRRGIEIVDRMRNNTIIARLNAWDLANPSGEVVDSTYGSGSDDDPFADQTTTTGAGSDDDPFADQNEKYTTDDVRSALQDWVREPGKNRSGKDVAAVLKQHGGVERFPDLKEENYAAVMRAIHG